MRVGYWLLSAQVRPNVKSTTMTRNQTPVNNSSMTIVFLVLANTILLRDEYTGNGGLSWLFIITIPLLVFAIFDRTRKKSLLNKEARTIRNNSSISNPYSFRNKEMNNTSKDIFETDQVSEIRSGKVVFKKKKFGREDKDFLYY
jgi:hypothetical protein